MRITGPWFQLEYTIKSTFALRREVVLHGGASVFITEQCWRRGWWVAFSFVARSRRGPCRSEQRELIAWMNLKGRTPAGDYARTQTKYQYSKTRLLLSMAMARSHLIALGMSDNIVLTYFAFFLRCAIPGPCLATRSVSFI